MLLYIEPTNNYRKISLANLPQYGAWCGSKTESVPLTLFSFC